MASRTTSLGRRLAASLAALALFAGLLPPVAEASDRHCRTQQEPAAAAHAGHGTTTHASHEAPSPGTPTQHQDCDHCPPTQCAIHEACGSATTASWQAGALHGVAGTHARIVKSHWRPTYSRSILPPTPPPTARL